MKYLFLISRWCLFLTSELKLHIDKLAKSDVQGLKNQIIDIFILNFCSVIHNLSFRTYNNGIWYTFTDCLL